MTLDRHTAARLDAWLTREPPEPVDFPPAELWEEWCDISMVPYDAAEDGSPDHAIFEKWVELMVLVDARQQRLEYESYEGQLEDEDEAVVYPNNINDLLK